MPPPKLKEIFEVESSFKSFYRGGDIQWSNDGKTFVCQSAGSIQFLDVVSGLVEGFVGDEELPTEDKDVDLVVAFTLCPEAEYLVSAHKSGLFKLWSCKGKSVLKQWKSVHKGPISKLAMNKKLGKLVSGGSDSSIRVWNLNQGSCIAHLTGIQGVCSLLEVFEDDAEEMTLLFGAGDDWVIRCWDLGSHQLQFSMEGHYSTVTSIAFSQPERIISCGRDKVIITWSLKDGKQLKVIPAYESLESVVALPGSVRAPGSDVKNKGGVYVATAGERGLIRLWDVEGVKEIYVQENSLVKKNEEGWLSISKLLYCQALSSFAVVSFDHNIFIHSLDTFVCTHQFAGFFDEILDLAFVGDDDSHLAVATNSPDIKLYTLADMSCSFLTGHTGFVVSITVSRAERNIFATASKDHSVRVWMLRGKTAACIASGMQHNSPVAGLAFSQTALTFLLSGGEDNILKKWKLTKNFGRDIGDTCLTLKASCLAHEKDINAISVSPNDKFIATASLDKTAKLWSADDLTPIGTFRGHRRGLWSVVFSPVDQVLLTASADTTLKIWSLSDLSCLKTLEGHESAVMKGLFLTRGLQVLSSSGDGLLKLWNLKTSECMASFEGHSGKVWALDVNKDESRLISGCSASKIVYWKDVTEERKLEEIEKKQTKVIMEQQLSNLIESKQYLDALKLALTLDRPATVLKIVQEIMKVGGDDLSSTVLQLTGAEQDSLLNCAAHWNTNSKTAYPAQTLVSILLPRIASGQLQVPQSLIEVLIPYTERHYARLSQLLQDLHLFDYTELLLMQK